MFKNPIDKLINYNDKSNIILINGGNHYNEVSSSSDEENLDDKYFFTSSYNDSILYNKGGSTHSNKFKTIVNLLHNKPMEKNKIKYKTEIVKVDDKDPIKLFVIFDAFQLKKKNIEMTKKSIFEFIKKNKSLIMMSKNTSFDNIKYKEKTNNKNFIFRSNSIPMVAIFTLQKGLKYYEEYDYDTKLSDEKNIDDNVVLIYKLLSRVICIVNNLSNNLIDCELYYINHEIVNEVSNVSLIKIDDNINISNYDSNNYLSLTLDEDMKILFKLICKHPIYKFKLKYNKE